MQSVNERTILVGILVVISVATLFCLISIATPGWNGYSIFRYGTTAALGIISLLLLVGCVAIAVIILIGLIQNKNLPLIFVALLIVSSIFLLGTFAPTPSSIAYSYNLMVTTFAFTYLSSIAATYWLFGLRGIDQTTTKPSEPSSQQQQQRPKLVMT